MKSIRIKKKKLKKKNRPNSPNLKSIGVKFSSPWPWAPLGPILFWSNWSPCDTYENPNRAQKVAHLGPFGGSFTPNFGPMQTQHGEHCLKRSFIDTKKKQWKIPMKTAVLKISDWAEHVPHFEAMWTSIWAEMGRTWTWGQAAPSWSQDGPKSEPCWPKLTPSGGDVAAMSDRKGAFGSAKCANYYSGWLPVPANMGPPPSWTSLTNLSVSLATKLPHLGTFRAGGLFLP